MTFNNIPEVVIDYVRRVFAAANDRVSRRISEHLSMHEESLDHKSEGRTFESFQARKVFK